MKFLVRLASVIAFVTTALSLSPERASADCTTDIQYVDRPRDARGTTITARVVDADHQVGDPLIVSRYTIEVDRVYAGSVPNSFVLDAYECHGLVGLETGRRFLLSTANIERPSPKESLVWYVSGGGELELVGIETPASGYPVEIRDIETLEQALQALGIDAPLPNTATLGVDGTNHELPAPAVLIVVSGLAALGAAAFIRARTAATSLRPRRIPVLSREDF